MMKEKVKNDNNNKKTNDKLHSIDRQYIRNPPPHSCRLLTFGPHVERNTIQYNRIVLSSSSAPLLPLCLSVEGLGICNAEMHAAFRTVYVVRSIYSPTLGSNLYETKER